MTFEWDERKNALNIAKHNISFFEAQKAFTNPFRLILEDSGHSLDEERLYCVGNVSGKIMTVRFTTRDQVIRIIGAGYWRKEKKIYETRNNLY